jgi:hypothetical protein
VFLEAGKEKTGLRRNENAYIVFRKAKIGLKENLLLDIPWGVFRWRDLSLSYMEHPVGK